MIHSQERKDVEIFMERAGKEGESLETVFGRGVRRIRQKRGLKQTELAEQVGYSDHSQITKIEKGSTVPSLDKAIRLAETLRVSLDAFLRAGREEPWEERSVLREGTRDGMSMAGLVTRCLEHSVSAQHAVESVIQDLSLLRTYR